MTDFRYEITVDPDGVLDVHLTGRIKSTGMQLFQQTFDEAFQQERKRIILDFSALEFLNSQAVGLLLKALGSLRQQGGNMAAHSVNEQILQVFRFLTLDQLMAICSSREEALGRLEDPIS